MSSVSSRKFNCCKAGQDIMIRKKKTHLPMVEIFDSLVHFKSLSNK